MSLKGFSFQGPPPRIHSLSISRDGFCLKIFPMTNDGDDEILFNSRIIFTCQSSDEDLLLFVVFWFLSYISKEISENQCQLHTSSLHFPILLLFLSSLSLSLSLSLSPILSLCISIYLYQSLCPSFSVFSLYLSIYIPLSLFPSSNVYFSVIDCLVQSLILFSLHISLFVSVHLYTSLCLSSSIYLSQFSGKHIFDFFQLTPILTKCIVTVRQDYNVKRYFHIFRSICIGLPSNVVRENCF